MLDHLKLPSRLVLVIFVYWIIQTVADVATMYFSPEYAEIKFNWSQVWMKKSLIALYFLITSFLAFVWYRDHTITVTNWLKSLLQLSLVGILWALVFEIHHSIIQIILFDNEAPFFEIYQRNLNLYTIYTYFSLFSIVVVANAYYYYRSMTQKKAESAELQLKLVNTELMLYRAQLEPHFLFNSLNSIASLVRLERKEQATDALSGLSTLLRSVVEVGNKQLMPLQWELEFTDHYVKLQKLRFGKKLEVNITATDIDDNAKLPVMLLQPLIENAINHGSLADSELCQIDVNLNKQGNDCYVLASNKVARNKSTESSGVGLQNMRYRLKALYQDDFELNTQEQQGQFKVHIRFSLHKAENQ